MATIPKTSVALLRAISEDSNSARWNDFYDRYQPVMEAYLKAAFPSVEQEDVIQETMVVFIDKVRNYEYDPDNKGLFRNYLIGILKFKAIEALKRRKREADNREEYKNDPTAEVDADREKAEREREEWRKTVGAMAIRELFNDKSITTQNKEIFRRVAIRGESAAYVAEAFGVTRNNVDQIKARLTQKLRDIIISMGRLDGHD